MFGRTQSTAYDAFNVRTVMCYDPRRAIYQLSGGKRLSQRHRSELSNVNKTSVTVITQNPQGAVVTLNSFSISWPP